MTVKSDRALEIERLARLDHQKGCRNEPPFEAISVNHLMVHEAAAVRQINRRSTR